MNKKDRKYWDIGLENFKKFVKEQGHPFVPMRKKGKHGSNSSFKDAAYTYGLDDNGNPFKTTKIDIREPIILPDFPLASSAASGFLF